MTVDGECVVGSMQHGTVPGQPEHSTRREQNSQEVVRRGMPQATSSLSGRQTEFLPEHAQTHQAVCKTHVPGFPVSILPHLLFVVGHWHHHRHQRMGRQKTETGTLMGREGFGGARCTLTCPFLKQLD